MGQFTSGLLLTRKVISLGINGRQCLFWGKAMRKWSAYPVKRYEYTNLLTLAHLTSVWSPIISSPSSSQMTWLQAITRMRSLLESLQSLMERLYSLLSLFVITNLNCREGTTKMGLILRSLHVLEMWKLFEKDSTLMMFCLLLWVSLLVGWKRTRGADSHSRRLWSSRLKRRQKGFKEWRFAKERRAEMMQAYRRITSWEKEGKKRGLLLQKFQRLFSMKGRLLRVRKCRKVKKNINLIQEKCRKIFWNQRDHPPTLFLMKMRLFCFRIKRNTFLKVNISQEKCLRNFLGPRIVRDLPLLKVNVNVLKHWGSTKLSLKLATWFLFQLSSSTKLQVLIRKVILENVSELYLQSPRKV